MADPPDIEVYADGRPPKTDGSFLAGRRLPVAAGIAVIEAVVMVFRGPGLLLSTLAAAVVLGLALWASFKLVKKGLLRDILWVIALSQAMVVAIPVLFGASFVIAILVGALLLAAVAVFFIRTRF